MRRSRALGGRNCSYWRGAFTLTELLLVVAMSLSLAALLLPCLARARAAANRAVCLNHHRQLAAVWMKRIPLLLFSAGHLEFPLDVHNIPDWIPAEADEGGHVLPTPAGPRETVPTKRGGRGKVDLHGIRRAGVPGACLPNK